jgi:hypothetical protein
MLKPGTFVSHFLNPRLQGTILPGGSPGRFKGLVNVAWENLGSYFIKPQFLRVDGKPIVVESKEVSVSA